MLFRRFEDVLTENRRLRDRLDRIDRLIPEFEESVSVVTDRQSRCWEEVAEQRSRIVALEMRKLRKFDPLRSKKRSRHAVATMTAQGSGAARESEEGEGAEAPIIVVDSELSE